jgi:hypothetical protein
MKKTDQRSASERYQRLFTTGIVALIFLCLNAPAWAGQAVVTQLKGQAERKLPGSEEWSTLDIGDRLPEGTSIVTGERSFVEMETDRGHRVKITAEAHVTLSTLQADKTKTFITKGKALSKVKPLQGSEQFLIQTPNAVCAVRGTEFWTGVNEKGTAVQVDHGTVGLQVRGTANEVAVHAGERASVLRDGTLIPPRNPASSGAGTRQDSPLAQEARHEVGLDMDRNQVMAAAAAEIRLAEYREGKSMVDAQGDRVRLEEYVLRPQPNQFKFVVLNERENRLDYFFYKGTFNTTLPADLSVALRDLNGKFGTTAPDYYLTSYEMGQSNTQDSVHDTATGGHLVQVTIDSNGDYVLTDNADPSNTRTVTASELQIDSTYKVYNPLTDSFFTATSDELSSVTKFSMYTADNQNYQDLAPGDTFWKTRFNDYTHALNNITKITYTQSGATNVLASTLDANWTYAGGFVLPVTEIDPNNYDVTITNYYGDGTYERYRTMLIDDEGKLAPLKAFSGVSSGATYKNELLKWNYEQQVTASEFEGRKIDLVVEPKIFINSGLIP